MELEKTVEKTTEESSRGSRMSKNILLTVTLASALTYMSCVDNNQKSMSDESGQVYNEIKADSVKTNHNGARVFYYGGRPYMYGTMHSDGTRFVPSESGHGGYFAKPGVKLSPISTPHTSSGTRGGFGSIGGGRSGAT